MDRPAPETFGRKSDAERWLSLAEAQIARREWLDPAAARVTVLHYAERWVAERNLAPRTRELYSGLLRLHIAPVLGGCRLADVTAGEVRRWRSTLLAAGVSQTTTAKAYRLLRAVFSTAVDDLVVVRNPCRIKGADQEPIRERPAASVPQVIALPLRHHLARFVASDPDALVFTGEKGGVLRRGNFRPAVRWAESIAAVGDGSGLPFPRSAPTQVTR